MSMLQLSSSVVLASLTSSTYIYLTARTIVGCCLTRRTFSPFSFALLILLGAVVGTAAQEDGRASVEPALARQAVTLIVDRCTICHTSDLISQQRLPEERWSATVDKMRHWGADLSEDEAAVLLQFITARYHPGASDDLPSIENESAMIGPTPGQ